MPTHYEMISLESNVYNRNNDETLLLLDQIEDEHQLDELDEIALDDEFSRKKKIVIDLIGERQFNEIVRAYRTHTTDANTNSKIMKIRRSINNGRTGK